MNQWKRAFTSLQKKMAWKAGASPALKRIYEYGQQQPQNKVVNGMFKGWKNREATFSFSQKTFNQMWKNATKIEN